MKNKFRLAVITHQGMVRSNNEDAYAVTADLTSNDWLSTFHAAKSAGSAIQEMTFEEGFGGVLLAVADGMGGANAGEIAAKIAIETICDSFANPANLQHLNQSPKAVLFEALLEANRRIISYSREHSSARGMGTTGIIAYIEPKGCHIAWVGDSRAYLFNSEDGLLQLSKDHSLVQELVDKHQLTQEEAFYHPDSNVITQSLGDPDRMPDPGYILTNLKPGDAIILCSDGLNSMIYDEDIERILKQAGAAQADYVATLLVNSANEAGGNDNTTIAVFQLTEGLIADAATVKPAEAVTIPAQGMPISPGLGSIGSDEALESVTGGRPKNIRKILLLFLMSVTAIFSIFVFVRENQKARQKALEESVIKEQQNNPLADSLYRDSMPRQSLLPLQQDSANTQIEDKIQIETSTLDSNPGALTTPVSPTEKKK